MKVSKWWQNFFLSGKIAAAIKSDWNYEEFVVSINRKKDKRERQGTDRQMSDTADKEKVWKSRTSFGSVREKMCSFTHHKAKLAFLG